VGAIEGTVGPLDEGESRELEAFAELDELLSLVNRLVRNAMDPGYGATRGLASASRALGIHRRIVAAR
jgi:hypothetical protein